MTQDVAGLLLLLAALGSAAAWSVLAPGDVSRRIGYVLVWWSAALSASALALAWAGWFDTWSFALVWLVVFGASIVALRRRRGGSGTSGDATPCAAGLDPSLAPAAVVIAVLAVRRRFFVDVAPFGDVYSYHLPMAAQWVQTGSFLTRDSRVWFYPGGYELLTSVAFQATGDDVLWWWCDVLALVALSNALWRLGTSFGLPGGLAAFGVAMVLCSPIVLRTVGQGDNDLWVAALVVSTVEFLARWVRHGDASDMRAGVLGVGLLAAAKITAWPFVVLVIVAVLLRRPVRGGSRDRWGVAAVALACLVGLSFPVRNWVLVGNPMYPTSVAGLWSWGDTSHVVAIPRAVTPLEMTHSSLRHGDATAWRYLGRHLRDLAWPILALGAIGLVASVSSSRRPGRPAWVVVAALVVSCAVFVMQPLVVENIPGTQNQIAGGWSLRFGIAAIVLAGFGMLCAARRRVAGTVAAAIATIAFVVVLEGESRAALLVAGLVFSAVGLAGAVVRRFRMRRISQVEPPLSEGRERTDRTNTRVAVVASVLVAFSLAAVVAAPPPSGRYSSDPAWAISSVLDACPSVRRLVASQEIRSWPLIGSRLQRRVVSEGRAAGPSAYLEAIDRVDADVLVLASSDLRSSDPAFGLLQAGAREILRTLGRDWVQGYTDDVVTTWWDADVSCDANRP